MFKYFRAIVLVFALLMPTALLAQSDTSTITFAGQPLEGSPDEMTDFVLGALRPTVASFEPQVITKSALSPFVPRASCFGVTERQADGSLLLLETMFATDLSDGRYNAVLPETGQHGDWPPHLPTFKLYSSQNLGCEEIVAEISWRIKFAPESAGALALTFELSQEHLDEYEVMASEGQLGLFVASMTPTVLTVNAETFESQGCADCLAHTKATTTTIGAGVYSPATVEWFGQETENAPGLTNMYVLPVPKKAGIQHSVVIEIDESEFQSTLPIVYIWFGRFDYPHANAK